MSKVRLCLKCYKKEYQNPHGGWFDVRLTQEEIRSKKLSQLIK